MFDISIIIFALALIAIIVMFISQYRKLKRNGTLHNDFPSKDFSYENFELLNTKMRRLWLTTIHGGAIIATKVWVRITYYISTFFHRGFKKVEERIIRIEKKNKENGDRSQSVFLTTIKTYKHEVKKLKGRVEEELPRPREEREEVANLEKSDNINESTPVRRLAEAQGEQKEIEN